MKDDTPIELTDISKMSNEDIDALIIKLRERRMKPVKVYQENQLLKQQAYKQGLEHKVAKQFEMFEKDIARVDKALEALEKRALNIRALRLELEDV